VAGWRLGDECAVGLGLVGLVALNGQAPVTGLLYNDAPWVGLWACRLRKPLI
jgi:hypothetical protein